MPQKRHHKQTLDDLASMITAMIPIAEDVLSSKYTAAERREFRQRFPADGDVFHLSNLFNALCSETARRLMLEENRQRQRRREHLQRLRERSAQTARTESESWTVGHSVTHGSATTWISGQASSDGNA